MEKRMKALVVERVDEAAIELLQQELDVDAEYGLSREEILAKIPEYDALLVRSKVKADKELLAVAKNLKVVGRAGNGIDNIDVAEASKYGVVVANTPDSNTISAGELAIGLILATSRNIPQANAHLKANKWDRNIFKGTELYNKTIGVVGLGRIGSLVATRMKAFGMKVIAYDPYITDERFERFGAEKRENFADLIKEADFITVHTPKTPETMGMIGEREIALMKEGVRLVNAARGGIICEKALYQGLKSGKVASVGLDVHEQEPCFNNPLYEFDNVIVTPHIGASTDEAQYDVGVTIAQQVLAALKGEIVTNAVNLPTLNREELSALKPYIGLMEKLGKIYYQAHSDLVESVDIRFHGNIARQDVEMITIAFLKGLLEPVVQEHVNYVNARLLAEQRGISVSQTKSIEPYNGFTDLITVTIRSKEKTFTLAGTLSAKLEGKLVEIQGFEIDIQPSEYMMFVRNNDVPGVIGAVGTILAEANVNIATMQVGRHSRGEMALMVLNIDDNLSKDTLTTISQIKNVVSAKVVRL